MPKPKRRRMTAVKLDEISGVDTPAQEGALAEFAKRKAAAVQGIAKAALTTATDGHTHLVSDYDGKGQLTNGTTSWSGSGGYETQHTHDWVRTEDGIVIGEAFGHTHAIAAMSVMKAQEANMTDEVKKDGETVETYKSAEGVEYKTPGEIALAKRLDEQTFEKRAGDEFPTVVAKGADGAGKALALAVIKGGDESALAGLKAVETALAETTKAAETNLDTALGSTAEAEGTDQYNLFLKGAQEFAEKNRMPESEAIGKFAATPEGAALVNPTH